MPLAEHDRYYFVETVSLAVSIHVPLAEHDAVNLDGHGLLNGFNSRAPRGARPSKADSFRLFSSFNSRAPRGARRQTP